MLVLEKQQMEEGLDGESLADRVRRLRKLAGLNQQRFADLVGVSMSQVQLVEQGITTELRGGTLRRYAEVLGVSTDYLSRVDDDEALAAQAISVRAFLRRRGIDDPSEHLIRSIEETIAYVKERDQEQRDQEQRAEGE